MADTVKLITPDGQVADFSAADAAFHVTHGWKPATPENVAQAKLVSESGGLGGQAVAGLESLARGLTGGFSDVWEARHGIDPAGIIARRTANPGTGAVGEGVGGAGLAAGLGALALATGGLGALGAAVAGGAAAGAITGAGSAIAEAELENKPLKSEQVAQSIVGNTLLGAATGGVGYGVGKGINALGRAAKGLPAFAERQALRSAGASAKQLGELELKGQTGAVGRNILEQDLLSQSPKAAYSAAQVQKASAGSVYGDIVSQGAATEGSGIADALRPLSQRGEFDVTKTPWKNTLNKLADKFENAGTVFPDEIQAAKKSIDEAIAQAGKGSAPKELFQAKRVLTDALEENIPAARATEFSKAKDTIGLASETAKAFKSRIGSDIKKPGFEQAAAFLNPFNIPSRVAKTASTSAWVAQGADKLSTTRAVQFLASQADARWDSALGRLLAEPEGAVLQFAAPNVGNYDAVAKAVSEAAQNPASLMERTHAALGEDLNAHHPDVADGAAASVQTALNFLEQNRPKSSLPPALFDTQYTPPDYLKAQWLDMVRAIQDPASVAANPTTDSLQALKAVYPESYNAITTRLQMRLQNVKGLTYAQKLQISQLIGANTSPLTDPKFVSTMQGVYQAQGAPPDKGQSGSARQNAATQAKTRQIKVKHASDDSETPVNRIQDRQ